MFCVYVLEGSQPIRVVSNWYYDMLRLPLYAVLFMGNDCMYQCYMYTLENIRYLKFCRYPLCKLF